MSLPPIDEDLESPKKGTSRFARVRSYLKKFDRNFLLVAAVAVVALVLIAGYAIFSAVSSGTDDPPAPPPTESTSTPSTSPTAEPNSPPTEEPASPLAKDGVDFATVADAKSPVTISVKGTVIKASQSGSPTLTLDKTSNVKAASTECKVKDTLSFCLVATTQFGSQQFDYFYSRDVAHSKLLRDSKDVRQVDIEGAASAAFVTIDFAGQGPRRVLAIATQDSSGYLVTLPEGSGTATEDTLLKGLALK